MQKINSNDEWLSATEKAQPSEDGAVANPASKWPQQRKKVWIISILAFVAAIVGVIVIVATANKQTTPSTEVSSVVLAADPGWPWSQAWAEFLNPSKKQDNSITINPFDNPGFAQQLQSSIKKEIDGSGIPTGAVIDGNKGNGGNGGIVINAGQVGVLPIAPTIVATTTQRGPSIFFGKE